MEQNTNETLKNIVSAKLPKIRTLLDVSRQQIATFVGISISQYTRLENGKAIPNILSLKIIVSDFFQISIDDFLNEKISVENLIFARQNSKCIFPLPSESRQNGNTAEKAKILIKNRLPLLRKMVGISTPTMVEQLNIHKATYYNWENGKTLPDPIMLKIIVTDILNYSLDDFLDESFPVDELIPLQGTVQTREKLLKTLVRERLPQLRENSKISQDEIATYLGVHKALYTAWEEGTILIDILSLRKIVVEVFNISLEEFLNDALSIERISSHLANDIKPLFLTPQERNLIMYYRRTAKFKDVF